MNSMLMRTELISGMRSSPWRIPTVCGIFSNRHQRLLNAQNLDIVNDSCQRLKYIFCFLSILLSLSNYTFIYKFNITASIARIIDPIVDRIIGFQSC